MKRKYLLKGISYLLVCAMIVEVMFLNYGTVVSSDENIMALKGNAIEWLENNQNENGSWGNTLHLYNTALTLKYTDENDMSYDIREKAVTYLKNAADNNNDDLFRKNSIKEIVTNTEIRDIIGMQNSDGSFSIREGYSGDVLDTVLALDTIINSSVINTRVTGNAATYIVNVQKEDGSFAYTKESEGSTYITAYAVHVLKQYMKQNNNSTESVKLAINNANEYLLSLEENLWGTDPVGMRNTMMATLALADLDRKKTTERIEKIADYVSEDGSLYSDVELTSMFIKLLDMYQVLVNEEGTSGNVEINDMYVYAEDGMEIKAYTDVYIVPEITGLDEEKMDVSVCIGKIRGEYKAIEQSDGKYVFNTEGMEPGEYEIYSIVTDKANGETLSLKKKTVTVENSVDISELYVDYSPKVYHINSGEEFKIKVSADLRCNYESELKAEIRVKDHNNSKVFESVVTSATNADKKYIDFEEISFVPATNEKTIFSIEVNVYKEEEVLASYKRDVNTLLADEEKTIEVSFSKDKEVISPEGDEVTINSEISGVGTSKDIVRQPMDIVINIDNSLSMDANELKQEKEVAKAIVDYLSEDDRAAIVYVSPKAADEITELTDDKDALKKRIDAVYSKYGTYIEKAINSGRTILENTEEGRKKVLLILSDGEPDNYKKTIANAQLAVEEGIEIHTLGIGLLQENTLIELAQIGGGLYTNADTTDELMDVMNAMAGELFGIAGKDVCLSMTVGKDINYEDIVFDKQPDMVETGDDGRTVISWNKKYISVGEKINNKFNIKTGKYTNETMILFENITLTYTNQDEEETVLDFDPVRVRVEAEETKDMEEDEVPPVVEQVDKPVPYAKNVIPKEENMTDEKLVEGSVDVKEKDIVTGTKVDADYTFKNYGAKAECGKIIINAVNTETGESGELLNREVEMSGGESLADVITIDTGRFSEGEYIVTYMLVTNETTVALGASGFVLTDPRYRLTIECSNGGDVTSQVGEEYKAGAVIPLKAVADDEYLFAGWESDNGLFVDRYSETTDFTMPDADVTIKANFELKKYMITVVSTTGGKIAAAQGEYHKGDKVLLEAQAYDGYKFDRYILDGEGSFSDSSSISTEFIVGSGDAAISAEFIKISESVTENRKEEVETTGRTVATVTDKETSETEVTAETKQKDRNEKVNGSLLKKETKSNETSDKKEETVSGSDGKITKPGAVVKTGDFATRDNIIRMIYLQAISAIILLLLAKKKEKTEENQ